LTDYVFLAVGRVGSATENVTQKVEYVGEQDKRDRLVKLLTENKGLTLIFIETKRNAESLEEFLLRSEFNATSIHGDRTQIQRETALAMFRAGKCPILVATSVAARGLDIPLVKYVINYDCPTSIEEYVHRIGRTGRAGHHGTSITFVDDSSRILREIHEILKENKQKIEDWFEKLSSQSGFSGGYGRGARRGGRGYGVRDFRQSPGFEKAVGDFASARARGDWGSSWGDLGQNSDSNYGGQSGSRGDNWNSN